MNNQPALQSILFGSFTPPMFAETRIHRIGMTGYSRYKATSPKAKKDPNELSLTEESCLRFVTLTGRPVRSSEVAKALNITTANATIVLANTFKKGQLTRTKVQDKNTRVYLYEAVK